MFVDDLDLVALEDGNIDELPRFLAVMLDDEQARRRHFEDEAEPRNGAGRAPHAQFAVQARYAQMNPGTLNRGRDFREHAWVERQRLGQDQRVGHLVRREPGQ